MSKTDNCQQEYTNLLDALKAYKLCITDLHPNLNNPSDKLSVQFEKVTGDIDSINNEINKPNADNQIHKPKADRQSVIEDVYKYLESSQEEKNKKKEINNTITQLSENDKTQLLFHFMEKYSDKTKDKINELLNICCKDDQHLLKEIFKLFDYINNDKITKLEEKTHEDYRNKFKNPLFYKKFNEELKKRFMILFCKTIGSPELLTKLKSVSLLIDDDYFTGAVDKLDDLFNKFPNLYNAMQLSSINYIDDELNEHLPDYDKDYFITEYVDYLVDFLEKQNIKSDCGKFFLKNLQLKLKSINKQQGGKKQFIRSEDKKKYKNKCIYTKPKGKTEYVKHNKQFITLKQFQKLK